MKIAAIILNYNSAVDTMKCIEFLLLQKLNEELHVIVVDNNSNEEPKVFEPLAIKLGIRNEELGIRSDIIYAEENRGYSAGNNFSGIRQGLSGYVHFSHL